MSLLGAWTSDEDVIRRVARDSPRRTDDRAIDTVRRADADATAIHYHVLVTGAGFIPHDVLRRLAMRAGFGPVCDVGRLRSAADGVSYASKYVLKDVDDWPAGRRVSSSSAGWRDPRYWKRYLTPFPPGTWLACRVGGEPMHVSASPWVHSSVGRGTAESEQSREFNEWVRKRRSEQLQEV